MSEDLSTKIQRLNDELIDFNNAYYLIGTSGVPDSVYDSMKSLLATLIESSGLPPPTDCVLNKVNDLNPKEATTYHHKVPMLSLKTETRTDFEGVTKWYNNLRDKLCEKSPYPIAPSLQISVELKYDGMAINLQYLGGSLNKALTRGDTFKGENLIKNIVDVEGVPLHVDEFKMYHWIEVRGEVVMTYTSFDTVNDILKGRGDKPYANARNAAAGIMRGDGEFSKYLTFFAYRVVAMFDMPIMKAVTQSDILRYLQEVGFKVYGTDIARSVQEMRKCYERTEELRSSNALSYDIDGVVYKVNDPRYRALLGEGSEYPNWALAHKFDPKEAMTTITDIEYRVGKTAAITPVAIVKPVSISGVWIAAANLHNLFEMRALRLKPGSVVMVRRAGDVIPEIYKKIDQDTSFHYPVAKFPKACPSCGAPVIRAKGKRKHYCSSGPFGFCPDTSAARLQHYASKMALDVPNIGPATAQALFDKTNIQSLQNFLSISEGMLQRAGLDGHQRKSINERLIEIYQKGIPLSNFIYAMCIEGVGFSTAKKLAAYFGTIERFLDASITELSAAENFLNPRRARYVFYVLQRHFSRATFGRKLPVIPANGRVPVRAGIISLFNNVTFAITGTFSNYTRMQMVDEITSRGGTVLPRVTKETDVLVVGQNPHSKLLEAQVRGIRIWSETSFKTALEQTLKVTRF